jgi:hypothetical protein
MTTCFPFWAGTLSDLPEPIVTATVAVVCPCGCPRLDEQQRSRPHAEASLKLIVIILALHWSFASRTRNGTKASALMPSITRRFIKHWTPSLGPFPLADERLIDHAVAAIHLNQPPALPMAAKLEICRRTLLDISISLSGVQDLVGRRWLPYLIRQELKAPASGQCRAVTLVGGWHETGSTSEAVATGIPEYGCAWKTFLLFRRKAKRGRFFSPSSR